ncbi:MAG: PilT/PilU family type 4a pilus ATPase [Candidatus Omnitrophica bacterium]|nr:PilT/PilU family type 4a pilus ATPase [Candidatus Omnitrophota bacterium]
MGIKYYLDLMVEKGASDMFFRAGGAVCMRINGKVESISDHVLTMDEVNDALKELLTDEARDFFRKNLDVDLAFYGSDMSHRFRASIFMQRNWPSIVIRSISQTVQTLEELQLPAAVLKKLALENRGLVLLTGAAGSGKSTTIASMLEHVNATSNKHVLTLEEPIEFVFKDKNSVINQRELGKDVTSYPIALRAFTLQSPDVIYIGNIRDLDTMSAAITSAETGVLVMSTLHAINAPQAVERIINFYPPHQHQQVRIQLSFLLKGVISLRLVPLKDGSGRIPAYEVMVLTPTISRLIREGKVWDIPQFIEDGTVFGMQSFNQSLAKLVREDKITEETAMEFADNPDEFVLALKGIKKK